MDFGRCLQPVKSEEKYTLATHHIAYKKEVLFKFKDNLGELLGNETVMINELKKNSYKAYLESGTRSYHINISKMSSLLASEFYGGRQFAANKSKFNNWSIVRRSVNIVGSPLRPVSKLYRITKDLFRTNKMKQLMPRILPGLALALIFYSAGEVLGYMFGAGKASANRVGVELNRSEHI